MTSLDLQVLPRTWARLADYPAGAAFGPRRLFDFELVWLLEGSARWRIEDPAAPGSPREYLLRPGQLALSHAGSVDSYQWDESQISRHAYVHFAIVDHDRLKDRADWPSVRQLTDKPILGALCNYLLELAEGQSAVDRQRSDEVVRLLLNIFVTEPPSRPGDLPFHVISLVDHVRQVWARRGMSSIPVEDLATASHLSAGHLYRLFRHHYGCGPAHALELIRLARAAVSLQRSNFTVKEISRQSGYRNPYHFSRRFSQVYGMPPTAFRSAKASTDPMEPIKRANLMPVANPLLNVKP